MQKDEIIIDFAGVKYTVPRLPFGVWKKILPRVSVITALTADRIRRLDISEDELNALADIIVLGINHSNPNFKRADVDAATGVSFNDLWDTAQKVLTMVGKQTEKPVGEPSAESGQTGAT